jgi:hypothetical protein
MYTIEYLNKQPNHNLNSILALKTGWTQVERSLCDDLGPIGDMKEKAWKHDRFKHLPVERYPSHPPCASDFYDPAMEAYKSVFPNKVKLFAENLEKVQRESGAMQADLYPFSASPRQITIALILTLSEK